MREKRTFLIPPPNRINRRVTQIAGEARHELSWDGPQGLLASLTVTLGRAQMALVDRGVVADAEGSTVRSAYREAWRELRLSQHDAADLLRLKAMYRRLWLNDESTIRSLFGSCDAKDRTIETLTDQRDRLEAENAALKQQVTTQAQELQALRDQLAACQRAPEEVTARLQKAEARLRDMQIRLSGALAHQATTQGRADELAKQLGVPASADLAVRGPDTKVYPLASQATSDAAAAGEAVRS